MIVEWEVDDGYCGGTRPQTTEIPDEDFDGLTKAEQDALIDEYVQEDFSQTVTWRITGVRKQ